MEWISLVIGGAQVVVGFAGYLQSEPEHRSLTALIPAGFGLIIAISGAIVAMAPSTRKHAMHAAATAALLAVVLVGGRAASKFPFVEARRARERAASANGTQVNT